MTRFGAGTSDGMKAEQRIQNPPLPHRGSKPAQSRAYEASIEILPALGVPMLLSHALHYLSLPAIWMALEPALGHWPLQIASPYMLVQIWPSVEDLLRDEHLRITRTEYG